MTPGTVLAFPTSSVRDKACTRDNINRYFGITWFLRLGGTKSVYLSGSGTWDPESWLIYVLAITECINRRTGTVISLERKILNNFRTNLSSWHEVLSQHTTFWLTVKEMLWPRMSATNQKVCAVVIDLMPNVFLVFSIRNPSWFIISKEIVSKLFLLTSCCFDINCLWWFWFAYPSHNIMYVVISCLPNFVY